MEEQYKIDWEKYLSIERWKEEHVIDSQKDTRNPFEVDFGKVVFCPALRRMHDKTQVIPLSSGDCVLTRLTHSMQVMNIAESLACNYTRSNSFKRLFENDKEAYETAQKIRAILKTASLLHDIGNPPFGHFGEDTIKNYFKELFASQYGKCISNELTKEEKVDFTQFDGNALGFRIVSKLQYAGSLDGLNLTYGTLGAYLKYPNEGEKDSSNKAYVGNHKHGIFKTESELFHRIVESCNMKKEDGTIKRHPLAFLVEAADTICYGTMDVEDGLLQGWYSVDELLENLNKYIRNETQNENLDIRQIIGFNYNKEEEDPRKVLLSLREHLITYLVDLVINKFNENIEKIDKGEYGENGEELVYDDSNKIAEALKVFTKRKILSNKNVLKFEITGNSVITGLFDILIKYFFHKDKAYHARLKGIISESRMAVTMKEGLPDKYPENKVITIDEIDEFKIGDLSSYERLRMIVDFVASMTDKYSVELYQTLSGNSL